LIDAISDAHVPEGGVFVMILDVNLERFLGSSQALLQTAQHNVTYRQLPIRFANT
jgi:hypothetical protein